MPLARTYSVALIGVTGHVVEIEADIANGLPAVIVVGLPDTALREARDRIRAAITNSREEWPQRKITVGLSPATLPKRGSWFDLAIAIGVLAAAGKVPRAAVDGVMFFGELGLDGRLRPVRGVLPAVAAAVEAGFGKVMVAELNAAEAVLVPGVRVIAATSLTAAADWLRGIPGRDGGPAAAELEGGQELPSRRALNGPGSSVGDSSSPSPGGDVQAAGRRIAIAPDLAELLGQSMARRAAEVCAAGGHHLSLLGPPGAGKTMLAERIPTILPRLDTAAALEVTAIHSVAGTLPPQVALLTDPPFLAPHHTATKAAIIGGGSGIILPGSASLAHRGVLFLDESRNTLRIHCEVSLSGTTCGGEAFVQVRVCLAGLRSVLVLMAERGVWRRAAMVRGVVLCAWCPDVLRLPADGDVHGVEAVAVPGLSAWPWAAAYSSACWPHGRPRPSLGGML